MPPVTFFSFFLSLSSAYRCAHACVSVHEERERGEWRKELRTSANADYFIRRFVRLFSCLLEKEEEEEDERTCENASAKHRRSSSPMTRWDLCVSASTKSLKRDRLFSIALFRRTDTRRINSAEKKTLIMKYQYVLSNSTLSSKQRR